MSHTGRRIVDSHARLRLKAGVQSTLVTYRARAVMNAGRLQATRNKQQIKSGRRFPRSFDRNHINTWLIAENSGKSLKVLSLPASLLARPAPRAEKSALIPLIFHASRVTRGLQPP